LLGYKTIGQLISMAATSKLMGKVLRAYGQSAEESWAHSLSVATGSKVLALRNNPSLENDAFAAGLIHDAGKLILEPHVHDQKEQFEAYTKGGRRTMGDAERKIFGFDHAEIGHEVCKHRKIPESIADAIRHHHQPDQSENEELAHIVAMANIIANMAKSMREMGNTLAGKDGVDGFIYMIDDDIMTQLKLDEKDIPTVLEEIEASVNRISDEMKAA
jgi:HD-like signal output (HDOD) protein